MRRIAAAAERPPNELWRAPHFRWEFKTVAKNEPNAFCLPGGKVVVYTVILPITKTEAGLAVVIGHEVAHALARHGAERMSDQIVAQVDATAAAVALSSTVNGRSRAYLPAMMRRSAPAPPWVSFRRCPGHRNRGRPHRPRADGTGRLRSARGDRGVGTHACRQYRPPPRSG